MHAPIDIGINKPGDPLHKIKADGLRAIEEVLNTIAVVPVTDDSLVGVQRDSTFGKGWEIRVPSGGATGSLDLSLFPFAPTLSGLTVTVAAGEVRRGIRAAVIVAQTDVELTASAYIYVNVVLATMACTIAQSATKPTSDATNYRRWLYYYTVADGVASLAGIGSLGNIELPGVTG